MNSQLDQNDRSTAEQGAGLDAVAQRLARVGAEVATGLRDSRSLIAIPAEAAKRATLTFPKDAFGPAEPWQD